MIWRWPPIGSGQTLWLIAVTILLTIIQAGIAEVRVVCYYTNWSIYRPGTAKFSPQNINPYLCTHLIYAFGGFTKENNLKPFDKYQDVEKGGYAKFTGLKTYNKNLKTMLAIGGWNEGSTRFSPLVASPERRKELVKNTIKFLRINHFDGLDLDWEYPSFRDGGKPRDKDNYAQLVQELREEFERESSKTGRPRLLLTMAVPAGIEYVDKGYDIPKLNKYLDWMNILSYDYHSAFEPAVNHHSPLYPLEEDNEYNFDADLNIDHTIKHYLESGAERSKLVLGIPTYGRSYTLFNPDATEIGAPADGPGEMGDATREKGYLAYYEICESLKTNPDEWTVVQPNPSAMGPYAYHDNQWVGYDDEAIVKRKAQYVAQNQLGGIMFWAIDNDDFRGNCHGRPYPLIEAAKEALIESIGNTDNVISEPKKPSKPLRSRTRSRISSKATSENDGKSSVKTSNSGGRQSFNDENSYTSSSSSRKRIAASRFKTKPVEETEEEEDEDEEVPLQRTTSRRRVTSNNKKQQQLDNEDNVVKQSSVSNSRRRINGRRSTTTTTTTTPAPSSLLHTPAYNTPEPPTTPDPGSDFKCEDEGFFPHPRDCKKYFWCLSSGPSDLGIVAHQFTCPSGLFFNKAADSCDYARNVLCKKKSATTTTTTTKAPRTTQATTTKLPFTTQRTPPKITAATAKNTFRYTTSTTPSPAFEEEYEYEDDLEDPEKVSDREFDPEEDPRVIKELIELIKKVGGVEELEKQLHLQEDGTATVTGSGSTTPPTISKSLYERVLSVRTQTNGRVNGLSTSKPLRQANVKYSSLNRNSRPGPQNEGIEKSADTDSYKKDKPKYVTISRQRPAYSRADDEETANSDDDETAIADEVSENTASKSSYTAKPEYVTIRRSRPSTTESAEDTQQSRSASFEDSHLDDDDNDDYQVTQGPEYVTIRRSRPILEESATSKYKTIQRSRSTTENSLSKPEVETERAKSPSTSTTSSTTTTSTSSSTSTTTTTAANNIKTTTDAQTTVSADSDLTLQQSNLQTNNTQEETNDITYRLLTTTVIDELIKPLITIQNVNDNKESDENFGVSPLNSFRSTTDSLLTLNEQNATSTTSTPSDVFNKTTPILSQPRPFSFNKRTRPSTTTTSTTTPVTPSTDEAQIKVSPKNEVSYLSSRRRRPTFNEANSVTPRGFSNNNNLNNNIDSLDGKNSVQNEIETQQQVTRNRGQSRFRVQNNTPNLGNQLPAEAQYNANTRKRPEQEDTGSRTRLIRRYRPAVNAQNNDNNNIKEKEQRNFRPTPIFEDLSSLTSVDMNLNGEQNQRTKSRRIYPQRKPDITTETTTKSSFPTRGRLLPRYGSSTPSTLSTNDLTLSEIPIKTTKSFKTFSSDAVSRFRIGTSFPVEDTYSDGTADHPDSLIQIVGTTPSTFSTYYDELYSDYSDYPESSSPTTKLFISPSKRSKFGSTVSDDYSIAPESSTPKLYTSRRSKYTLPNDVSSSTEPNDPNLSTRLYTFPSRYSKPGIDKAASLARSRTNNEQFVGRSSISPPESEKPSRRIRFRTTTSGEPTHTTPKNYLSRGRLIPVYASSIVPEPTTEILTTDYDQYTTENDFDELRVSTASLETSTNNFYETTTDSFNNENEINEKSTVQSLASSLLARGKPFNTTPKPELEATIRSRRLPNRGRKFYSTNNNSFGYRNTGEQTKDGRTFDDSITDTSNSKENIKIHRFKPVNLENESKQLNRTRNIYSVNERNLNKFRPNVETRKVSVKFNEYNDTNETNENSTNHQTDFKETDKDGIELNVTDNKTDKNGNQTEINNLQNGVRRFRPVKLSPKEDQEESFNLSETIIQETGAQVIHLDDKDAAANGKHRRRKVIKRIRPISASLPEMSTEQDYMVDSIDPKVSSDQTLGKTEPSIVVRTRKIVRKLKATTESSISTDENQMSKTDVKIDVDNFEFGNTNGTNRRRKIIRRLRPASSTTTSTTVTTSSPSSISFATTESEESLSTIGEDFTTSTENDEVTSSTEILKDDTEGQTTELTLNDSHLLNNDDNQTISNNNSTTVSAVSSTTEQSSVKPLRPSRLGYKPRRPSLNLISGSSSTTEIPTLTSERSYKRKFSFVTSTTGRTDPKPAVRPSFKPTRLKTIYRPSSTETPKIDADENYELDDNEEKILVESDTKEKVENEDTSERFSLLGDNIGNEEDGNDENKEDEESNQKYEDSETENEEEEKDDDNNKRPAFRPVLKRPIFNRGDSTTNVQETEDTNENKDRPFKPLLKRPSFTRPDTAQIRVANRPDLSLKKPLRKYVQNKETKSDLPEKDLSGINIEAVNIRNKNLFNKSRKMNVPVGTLSSTDKQIITDESNAPTANESYDTTSSMSGLTDFTTDMSFSSTDSSSDSTTLSPLIHVFAEIEDALNDSINGVVGMTKHDEPETTTNYPVYVRNGTTPLPYLRFNVSESNTAEKERKGLEKIVEVNRIAEVVVKDEMDKEHNATNKIGTKYMDKIGEVNRVTVIKVVDGEINNNTNGIEGYDERLETTTDYANKQNHITEHSKKADQSKNSFQIFSKGNLVDYGKNNEGLNIFDTTESITSTLPIENEFLLSNKKGKKISSNSEANQNTQFNLNSYTVRPIYFSTEASTIALEGLFMTESPKTYPFLPITSNPTSATKTPEVGLPTLKEVVNVNQEVKVPLTSSQPNVLDVRVLEQDKSLNRSDPIANTVILPVRILEQDSNSVSNVHNPESTTIADLSFLTVKPLTVQNKGDYIQVIPLKKSSQQTSKKVPVIVEPVNSKKNKQSDQEAVESRKFQHIQGASIVSRIVENPDGSRLAIVVPDNSDSIFINNNESSGIRRRQVDDSESTEASKKPLFLRRPSRRPAITSRTTAASTVNVTSTPAPPRPTKIVRRKFLQSRPRTPTNSTVNVTTTERPTATSIRPATNRFRFASRKPPLAVLRNQPTSTIVPDVTTDDVNDQTLESSNRQTLSHDDDNLQKNIESGEEEVDDGDTTELSDLALALHNLQKAPLPTPSGLRFNDKSEPPKQPQESDEYSDYYSSSIGSSTSTTYRTPITVITYSTPKVQYFKNRQRTRLTTLTTTVSPPSSTTYIVRRRRPEEFAKITTGHPIIPGHTYRPVVDYDYYDDGDATIIDQTPVRGKVLIHSTGRIQCLDQGNFPHPVSCKKFISCAKIENGAVIGWEYTCPKNLSFDPIGGICNWSAGLGCKEIS